MIIFIHQILHSRRPSLQQRVGCIRYRQLSSQSSQIPTPFSFISRFLHIMDETPLLINETLFLTDELQFSWMLNLFSSIKSWMQICPSIAYWKKREDFQILILVNNSRYGFHILITLWELFCIDSFRCTLYKLCKQIIIPCQLLIACKLLISFVLLLFFFKNLIWLYPNGAKWFKQTVFFGTRMSEIWGFYLVKINCKLLAFKTNNTHVNFSQVIQEVLNNP
jgi:hypothetical protein